MRVMVMIKATDETEAGVPPDQSLLTEMMKYNESAGESRNDARGRRASAKFERRASQVLW